MNSQPQTPTRPRILFVDDSRLMRVSGTRILESRYEVVTAEDGLQAWELLRDDPTIQALFTDISMPGMDGYKLLDKVRSADGERLRKLPVIVLTGSEEQEAARRTALERGANDFLRKPFKPSELIARAATHTSLREASLRLRRFASQSQTDELTGLGNHRSCIERVGQALSHARRHDQTLTLIHVQVDTEGQEVDLSLRAAAGVFVATARQEDSACRTGSDLFTMILPSTDEAGAKNLCQRIEAELAHHAIPIRFSVQCPPLDPPCSAEQILSLGLKNLGAPSRALSATTDKPAPDLEEALALIANGDSASVIPHLSQLMAQIKPLTDLHRQQAASAYRPSRLRTLVEADTA